MSDPLLELARLIEFRSGFVIPERGYGSLADFASRRFEKLRLSGMAQYVDQLRDHGDSEEWHRLMSSITIKESSLFRGRAQFEALEVAVLPELAQNCPEGRLRVWCAGCARGEEAATLAIVLAECEALEGWDWSILATDVDDAALAEARLGRFVGRSMEAVSPERRDRHFLRRGGYFELVPDLLSRIQFLHLNLAQPSFRPPGAPFNLVFLRNVLIYFRPEIQRRVVTSVEGALDRNGCLFLGPSESLLPLDVSLTARDLGGAFCYGWACGGGSVTTRPPIHGESASTQPEGSARDFESPRRNRRETAEVIPLNDRIEPVIVALIEGETSRAVRVVEVLRRELPDETVIRVLEGVAKARSGEREASVLALRAALYLAPDSFEARFLLARVYDSLDRPGRAQREYRVILAVLESSKTETRDVFLRIGIPDRDEILRLCRQQCDETET